MRLLLAPGSLILPAGDITRSDMRRLLWGLMVCASTAVMAGNGRHASEQAVLQQAEASMRITGRISIDSQGLVTSYSIDHRAKVPAGVLGLVEQTVPRWVFAPVQKDGAPVPAAAKMSLLLVAHKPDDTHYQIRIKGGWFEDAGSVPTNALQAVPKSHRNAPPRYPADAVAGTVYVIARYGRDGRVMESGVEQVNLRAIGTPKQMAHWRTVLADNTLPVIRKWRFTPPTQGSNADADYWDIRVPVKYVSGPESTAYGSWEPYIPGPSMAMPWRANEKPNPWAAPDAFGGSEPHLVGSGWQLLTPFPEG